MEEGVRGWPVTFPDDFWWGTATASHQVEGENWNNDWWHWEQQLARIDDGSRSGRAAEWWFGRAEEDLRRAAALGQNAHRMSLEWSRLEPEPGRFDSAAFERYRAILGTLHDLGMRASVTLYHFTLPRWAAARGGWTDPQMPRLFARYVRECVLRLGDLVEWWATINEPLILVYTGYFGERWPPGYGSLRPGLEAAAMLLRAHHAGYLAAKEARPAAQVGLVVNIPALDPSRPRALDRTVAWLQDILMNELALRVQRDGMLLFPLALRNERLPGGPGASDWYGLNYYGRHLIRFDITRPDLFFGRHVHEGIRSAKGDWGMIYPEGLKRGLRRLYTMGKPLFVTENGIYDNDDSCRPAFLLRHLRATAEAAREGIDVRGYFHWSLVDNFEWAEGWSTRFGLFELNPVTQERRPRRSAALFEAVVRANAISRELWEEVVSSG